MTSGPEIASRIATLFLMLRRRRLLCLIAAVLLILPVFARPTWMIPGPTYRWLIVIDITESMNVRDISGHPADFSRLDAAKEAVTTAMRALPCGSQVALGLFAGNDTTTLFEPLEICRHFPAIEQVVARLDWRMGWVGDSRIETALVHAIGEARQRKLNLLFVTDGDEAPRRSAARITELYALRGHIQGALIGIGGESLQPVPRLDDDNQIVGYWQPADAVREGFHPNNVAAITGLEAGVGTPDGAGFEEVEEHLSALRGRYLAELASATGFDYVEAKRPGLLAEAATQTSAADNQAAERDIRVGFAFASVLLVLFSWRAAARAH